MRFRKIFFVIILAGGLLGGLVSSRAGNLDEPFSPTRRQWLRVYLSLVLGQFDKHNTTVHIKDNGVLLELYLKPGQSKKFALQELEIMTNVVQGMLEEFDWSRELIVEAIMFKRSKGEWKQVHRETLRKNKPEKP